MIEQSSSFLCSHIGLHHQSHAMHLFRRLAASSRDLTVGVYGDFFQFAEQYDAVLPDTLLNVALATACVIVVSLLLIPEPFAALYVSLTIVSINVGIFGYMSWWSVRLDFVSMVTIVMSIGFSVDFSAHIAYHFAKEPSADVAARLRAAVYAVGLPIVQSATSTILGVLCLLLVDSYVYRSFLKTAILIVLLGTFHGLLILPVLLTFFACKPTARSPQSTDSSSRGIPETVSTISISVPHHRWDDQSFRYVFLKISTTAATIVSQAHAAATSRLHGQSIACEHSPGDQP